MRLIRLLVTLLPVFITLHASGAEAQLQVRQGAPSGQRQDQTGESPPMASAENRSAAPAESQHVVMPGGVFARTTVEEMRAYDAAHPDVQPRVTPFPRAPSHQEVGDVRGADQQGLPLQGHLPADPQPVSVQEPPGNLGPPTPLALPLLDNFSGVLDNGTSIPPDTMGTAGPFHLVELINTGFTVFLKNGAVVSPQVSLRSFFSALGTGAGQPAEFPFDPKILYDQYVDRWVLTADGGGANSWVLLGISNTNNPTLSWNLFAIQANINSGGANHTGDFADFPGFGLDPNNIIVTNNMFGAVQHSDVWVIDKAAMIAGAPLTLGSNFSHFHNPGNTGGFTFRACHTYGQTSANAVNYLLDGPWTSGATRLLRIKEITGTGASAVLNTFGGNDWIRVAGFDFSVSGTQPAGCFPVETGGTTLRNCVWRNGKIWTTQSVGVGGRGQVAWYEIDPTTVGALALPGFPIQQGRVSDPTLSFYYPSIAVNVLECVALGFSGSDANTFISAYFTARDPTVDPPGTMQPVALLKAGVDTYFKEFGGFRNRWGDYSATVVDPADDFTFWTLQEYAEAELGAGNCGADTGRWSTWWGKFTCLADSSPPSPDPMQWEPGGEPAAISTSEIGMTAALATDTQNSVEYCLMGLSGPGVGSLCWQATRTFTDTGLAANTIYSYDVRARDTAIPPNETSPSSPAISDATFIESPTIIFFGAPTDTSVSLTAFNPNGVFSNLAVDSSGLFFEMTPSGGVNANVWVQAQFVDVTGLTPGTEYTVRVKARNRLGVETPFSPSQTVTTTGGCTLVGDVNQDGLINGADIGGYLRAKLMQAPAVGEDPLCADFGNGGDLALDTAAFVSSLLLN